MAERKVPCPELSHVPGEKDCKEARRQTNPKCFGCNRDRSTRNQKAIAKGRSRVIRLPPQSQVPCQQEARGHYNPT